MLITAFKTDELIRYNYDSILLRRIEINVT